MSAKKLIVERKLIKLLKILTKEELKLFEKYVQSIYFNRNQKVIQLLIQMLSICLISVTHTTHMIRRIHFNKHYTFMKRNTISTLNMFNMGN